MDRQTASSIERWRTAGVIDDATAERIRVWEQLHEAGQGSRLARFAFAFGGLLLGAGVLLFVAANWDQLSPGSRFATLASTVAILHLLGGVAASRSAALATTLHAVGTGAFGGAVFLAGQVFNLAEEWPSGFLAWAIGAGVALRVLRDWPHVLWVAVLVPVWLAAEWVDSTRSGARADVVLAIGLFLASVAYLGAVGPHDAAAWRRALARVGGIAVVPASIALSFAGESHHSEANLPATTLAAGWVVAIGMPVLLAAWLRGRAAWPMLVALAFGLVLTSLHYGQESQRLLAYAAYAAGSVGLVAWGLRDAHALRVNLGVLGFALSVLAFYHSSLFDRLGRSLGLIGLGVLFIGGGWWLEHVRRRLVGRIEGGQP